MRPTAQEARPTVSATLALPHDALRLVLLALLALLALRGEAAIELDVPDQPTRLSHGASLVLAGCLRLADGRHRLFRVLQ
eukprot:1847034-Alexandrium_andersonii.AAC.1